MASARRKARRKAMPAKVPWSVMLDGYAYYRTTMLMPETPGDRHGFAARAEACKNTVPPGIGCLDEGGEWDVYEFAQSAHYGGGHEAAVEGGWKVTVVARVSVCRQVHVLACDEGEAYDEAYRFLDSLAFTWPETLGRWSVETRCGIEACEAEEADHQPTIVWTGQ